MPLPFIDRFEADTADGKLMEASALVGAYIKSITPEGIVTVQLANDAEDTVTINVLTVEERHDIHSIPGLLAKTADLLVEVLARTWGNVTDVALGGFVSENDGTLSSLDASGLAYVISSTPTAGDSRNNFVYIRIPNTRDARDYRIRQSGSLGEFFITSWDHVGDVGNFKYYRSRHNLFENYSVTIQYDTASATQTEFRGSVPALEDRIDAIEVDIADLPNLEEKTGDLIVHTIRIWNDATDAQVAGLLGKPSSLIDLTGLTYENSITQGPAERYIIVRIPLANDLRDYRVYQTDAGYEEDWPHLELLQEDATYRYGGTSVHIEEGSTIIAQVASEGIHTSYRGTIDQSDWDETDSTENSYIQNTDQVKAQLADLSNLEAKTGDLIVHTTRSWVNATDAEVTGFAGRPASLGDITGETYHISLTQGVAEDYIVIRIPLANDLRDYRINQTDTGYEHNWQHLELIDIDATYRYGGTFVRIIGGSTIRAQYSDTIVHTEYRGDVDSKADTDLQNIDDNLTATEQEVIRTRIDAAHTSGSRTVDRTLHVTYTINEEVGAVDTVVNRSYLGNIYRVRARDLALGFRMRIRVNPAFQSEYEMLYYPMLRFADDDYRPEGTVVTLGALTTNIVAANTEVELEFAFVGANMTEVTEDVEGDTYFAFMLHETVGLGRATSGYLGNYTSETTTSVVGFDFIGSAASTDAPSSTENLFLSADLATSMDIDFQIVIDDAFDVEQDGRHIISIPSALDFRGRVTVEEADTDKARITIFGNNPVAYWWCEGATERVPDDYPYEGTPGSNQRRLQFSSDFPSEHFFGGDTVIGSIFVAGASVSTDLDAGPTPAINTDRVVFQLSTGVWDVTVWIESSITDENQYLRLNRITPGVDDKRISSDVIWGTSDDMESGNPALQGAGRLRATELQADGSEEFYFVVSGVSSDSQTFRYYLRVERLS